MVLALNSFLGSFTYYWLMHWVCGRTEPSGLFHTHTALETVSSIRYFVGDSFDGCYQRGSEPGSWRAGGVTL